MPSADVKPYACSLILTTLLLVVPEPTPTAAGSLGTTIPGNCSEHTSFSGGVDVGGDFRCAGEAIQFHTSGVGSSPYQIWAGQWLFVDPSGNFRVGSCTFNRGIHPTINSPARWVGQSFPNDPTGVLSAYLAWRYGDTADNLTAAALWAVFHYYAQDAAGPNRSGDDNAPLVPTLDGIASASGRDDLQARAQALHAEAEAVGQPWTLALSVAADGNATATLLSGTNPVPDQQVSVLVSGLDVPLVAITSTDGTATVTVPLPPGTVTVVATASAPGPAHVYRGEPASTDGAGGQNLITGGASQILRAETSIEVASPTTQPPTTTTRPETTQPETTTTTLSEPAATSTEVPTATIESASTTELAPESETTTTYIAVADPTTTVLGGLPRTGGQGDGSVAYIGTALLVGGIGLMGTLRRRTMGA